jgi:hypothetical protein
LKILVIEKNDLGSLLPMIKRGLERHLNVSPGPQVFTATSIEDARKVIEENPDLDIIVLEDELMDGDKCFNQKTFSFAEEIRSKFGSGLILIGMSAISIRTIPKEMTRVCDHTTWKGDVVVFVKNLLMQMVNC